MTKKEMQSQDGMGRGSETYKEYILVSLLIIGVFLGLNILGFFLNIMEPFIIIVLFALFFLGTMFIVRYSDQLETVSVEKWGNRSRKYSHLIGGLVMIFFAVLSTIQLSWICFSIFVTFSIHEYFYVKKNIYCIFTKTLIFVGRLDRRYNPEDPGKPVPFYPTLWTLAAISIIGLFGQMVVIATIVAFALGDSLSAIVGERFGKHKLPYNKSKSIEGSLVFFGITFIGVFGAYLWGGLYLWLPALITAIVGTLAESVIPSHYWLDDNFVVPVSVGFVLYISRVL